MNEYQYIVEQRGRMPPQYPNWDDEAGGEDEGEEEDDKANAR